MVEKTLFIIKPDAVERGLVGRIIAMIEESGLEVVALRMTRLTERAAGDFYGVHRGKDFFDNLVKYMTSGRIVAGMAEGEDAIKRLRAVCGATDPAAAAPGTIRAVFGAGLTKNSIHASDGPDTAEYETDFFFSDEERPR
jgi:nucleoside-diphosphate kinase